MKVARSPRRECAQVKNHHTFRNREKKQQAQNSQDQLYRDDYNYEPFFLSFFTSDTLCLNLLVSYIRTCDAQIIADFFCKTFAYYLYFFHYVVLRIK